MQPMNVYIMKNTETENDKFCDNVNKAKNKQTHSCVQMIEDYTTKLN